VESVVLIWQDQPGQADSILDIYLQSPNSDPQNRVRALVIKWALQGQYNEDDIKRELEIITDMTARLLLLEYAIIKPFRDSQWERAQYWLEVAFAYLPCDSIDYVYYKLMLRECCFQLGNSEGVELPTRGIQGVAEMYPVLFRLLSQERFPAH